VIRSVPFSIAAIAARHSGAEISPMVENPCLDGMKLQAAFFQPLREPFSNVLRLFQTATVNQSIIRVSAKGQTRKLNRHPTIETCGVPFVR
jgi:hypothetical protein